MSFCIDIILKQKKKKNHNAFTVSSEKSNLVTFASSAMKCIAFSPTQSRFAVKIICCHHLVLVVCLNLFLSSYNSL